jgi:hypothetical protein
MADQGRWFKVWTSILDDPHVQELALEDIGRWVLLGAMTKLVGTRGVLTLRGVRRLSEVLRCPQTELKRVIERFPNVSFEEGTKRDGEFTVTFKNWQKYQVDTTGGQRMKALRSKRRRDKKGSGREKKKLKAPDGFSIPSIGSAEGRTRPAGPEAIGEILARVGFNPASQEGRP